MMSTSSEQHARCYTCKVALHTHEDSKKHVIESLGHPDENPITRTLVHKEEGVMYSHCITFLKHGRVLIFREADESQAHLREWSMEDEFEWAMKELDRQAGWWNEVRTVSQPLSNPE